MLINIEEQGAITLVHVSANVLTSSALPNLLQARMQMQSAGRKAMLVDLSRVRRINQSGLGALVELTAEFGVSSAIGYYAPSENVAQTIARCPAASMLRVFNTLNDALTQAPFKAEQLCGTRAVVLCAGRGTRMGPLCRTTPKPMLDFLGRPVLHHLLDHLSSYGVNDVILNPGYLAEEIHNNLHRATSRSLFFLNEGRNDRDKWVASPLGSASTLARLQRQHTAFEDSFFVFCGDALTDLDLASMMRHHRATDADVTIAAHRIAPEHSEKYGILQLSGVSRVRGFQEKPPQRLAASNLASTGIYLFHPRVLGLLQDRPGQDIAKDLLPAVLNSGGHIEAFDPHFCWTDIGTAQDYFSALVRGLKGENVGLSAAGMATGSAGSVRHPSAVPRKVSMQGPCYIAPSAKILGPVELEGPVILGAGTVIEGPAFLKNTLITPNTNVQSGAWIEDMIVGPDWAFNHTADPTAPANLTPLDAVGSSVPTALTSPEQERQIS